MCAVFSEHAHTLLKFCRLRCVGYPNRGGGSLCLHLCGAAFLDCPANHAGQQAERNPGTEHQHWPLVAASGKYAIERSRVEEAPGTII